MQRPYHHLKAPARPAFTITELLIVIGVIAALLAVAVPALRGVQQRNRKMMEAQNIRQVHLAWMVYGNFNRDAALPGYLDYDNGPASQNVQEAWRVQYEYPVPPDPVQPNARTIPHEIASPWTWRLMQYLDHSLSTIWRYRNLDNDLAVLAAIARQGDPNNEFVDFDDLMRTIALEPEFAYNAYHVGGWWRMESAPGGGPGAYMPLFRFHDAQALDDLGIPTGGTADVVSRSIHHIRRAAEVVIYCTGTRYEDADIKEFNNDRQPGWHFITPPHFAQHQRWNSATDSYGNTIPDRIVTLNALNFPEDFFVPYGRYNKMVTVIHADGSIETTMPMNLATPLRWIDSADSDWFQFQEPPP